MKYKNQTSETIMIREGITAGHYGWTKLKANQTIELNDAGMARRLGLSEVIETKTATIGDTKVETKVIQTNKPKVEEIKLPKPKTTKKSWKKSKK